MLWIDAARKKIGIREVKGKAHNPQIVAWLKRLKAWWFDDETPWCGAFVAECLVEAGEDIPDAWYRARAYLNYGVPLSRAVMGCIVIFNRVGGGHVGFVVGQDKSGNLMVLGGNQGDAVNIKPFPMRRVAGFVWPNKSPKYMQLAVIDSDGKLSTNEA
jgi:uncharacterized protein (TIGR02594 family)